MSMEPNDGSVEPRRYHPFYCEENVWWLVQEPRFEACATFVVFISNHQRKCALYEQRIAPPGSSVIWDYHVILVAGRVGGFEVWDLDSRLTPPQPLGRYLASTFRPVPAACAPKFRVVPAAEMLVTLTTDRTHMRTKRGEYRQAPPPWDPPRAPGHEMNLMRFVDMTDPICGVVAELADLEGVLSGSAARA